MVYYFNTLLLAEEMTSLYIIRRFNMKIKSTLILILFFLSAGLAQARTLPDFTFKTLDGKVFDLAKVKGSPMVVYVGTHL